MTKRWFSFSVTLQSDPTVSTLSLSQVKLKMCKIKVLIQFTILSNDLHSHTHWTVVLVLLLVTFVFGVEPFQQGS